MINSSIGRQDQGKFAVSFNHLMSFFPLAENNLIPFFLAKKGLNIHPSLFSCSYCMVLCANSLLYSMVCLNAQQSTIHRLVTLISCTQWNNFEALVKAVDAIKEQIINPPMNCKRMVSPWIHLSIMHIEIIQRSCILE